MIVAIIFLITLINFPAKNSGCAGPVESDLASLRNIKYLGTLWKVLI